MVEILKSSGDIQKCCYYAVGVSSDDSIALIAAYQKTIALIFYFITKPSINMTSSADREGMSSSLI